MSTTKTNKGGISDAELSKLRSQYPNLRCGSIENLANPGERLYFYYTEPTIDDFRRSMAHIRDNNIVAARHHYHTHCMRWQQPEVIATNAEKNKLAIGIFIGDKFKIADGQDEDF